MSSSDQEEQFRPPPGGDVMGHPRGLWMLFSAEFWERFSFYGMRALLAPYVAAAFFAHLGTGAEAEASKTYGGYTALVYMTGILGGYVADRILGYQRSIMLGGALMAAGMFVLLTPNLTAFLFGLALITVGNGLFKPNISSMVGKLYAPGDIRRDSGFTIFYMGINAGALLAPIITGTVVGAIYGLKWGFFVAGVGMIFGIMVFHLLRGWLGHVGESPAGREGFGPLIYVLVGAMILVPPVFFLLSRSEVLGGLLIVMMLGLIVYFLWSGISSGDPVQRDRYIAMLLLFVANAFFWSLFEQAGSSLNFFARDMTDLSIGSFSIHFTAFQSANPIFIILFAPLFAMLWTKLDKRGVNPSIPRKFALGLIQVAIGFVILVAAIHYFQNSGGQVHWIFLALTYMLHTMGELCLSPIGLSMVTKLAKPREVGLAMGGWFLSVAGGNYAAGLIAAIASGGDSIEGESAQITQYADVYMQLFWVGLALGVIFLVAAPLINRLMHGVK